MTIIINHSYYENISGVPMEVDQYFYVDDAYPYIEGFRLLAVPEDKIDVAQILAMHVAKKLMKCILTLKKNNQEITSETELLLIRGNTHYVGAVQILDEELPFYRYHVKLEKFKNFLEKEEMYTHIYSHIVEIMYLLVVQYDKAVGEQIDKNIGMQRYLQAFYPQRKSVIKRFNGISEK